MKKMIISFSLILMTFLNAATLKSDKNTYIAPASVKITFSNMTAKNKDWIGIYPANTSNAWGNVIAWKWTEDKASGVLNFRNLPIGDYEARAFYNNSFKTEARHKFTVNDELGVEPILGMFISKRSPIDGQELNNKMLVIDYYKISENSMKKDWIGIYKKGTSNAWENVIKWKWVKDLNRFNPPEEGASIYFLPNIEKDAFNLPAGKYEIRLFRHNSFTLHSKVDLTINDDLGEEKLGMFISKRSPIDNHELDNKVLVIDYYKISENSMKKDWIGIYKKGTSNAWENVINWKWVKDLKRFNPPEVGASIYFLPNIEKGAFNLPAGKYEVRLFRHNSFNLHSKVDLTIGKSTGSITLGYSRHRTMKLTYNKGTIMHKLDWVALYEKKKSNAWENVIKWAWVKDLKGNEFDVSDVDFPGLMDETRPSYEIRFFRNNSFNLDTAANFDPYHDF